MRLSLISLQSHLNSLSDLLAMLIPGGPIENRDFSHLSPVVVWLFNSFLTALGFSSLIIAYFLFAERVWAYKISIFVGALYSILAALDLLKIFPKSPTPMNMLLFSFEMIIMLLGIVLILFAYKSLQTKSIKNKRLHIVSKSRLVIILSIIILIAVIIVIYASLAILSR